MEEAPENGKELLHSAHANGINEWMNSAYSSNIFKIHESIIRLLWMADIDILVINYSRN
jgi:hypothetical protein